MATDCLFCKMVSGAIRPATVYEDADVLAFRDINPQAPQHFLVIPKKHLSGPGAATQGDEALIGRVMRVGADLAKGRGVEHFRFVVNNGAEAGQTVFHFHLHVLGGRHMAWPPG